MSELPQIAGTSAMSANAIPADIRAKGSKAVAIYSAALQIEQTFLEQLTQAMNPAASLDTSADDSGDSSESDDSSGLGGMYSDMIPNAMAQGLTSAGGIGLARTIAEGMGMQR